MQDKLQNLFIFHNILLQQTLKEEKMKDYNSDILYTIILIILAICCLSANLFDKAIRYINSN